MNVLVDTSVWIRFLAGKEPWTTRLAAILAREEVLAHPLVYGELLMGDNGGRGRLLRDYLLMRQAPIVDHDEIVAFVKRQRLTARGLGWIDAHLLASTLVASARLWSADDVLIKAADEMGAAFG